MTDNIEKILFLKSMKNGKKQMEVCVFYQNRALKYFSYEDGLRLLKKMIAEENTNIQDLQSYDKMEILPKEEFYQKYKYRLEQKVGALAYQEYVDSQPKKEKEEKKKKKVKKNQEKKKSNLDKVSFIRRPIKVATLIGGMILAGFMGIKTYKTLTTESLPPVEKTMVKNLDYDSSKFGDDHYVLNKAKDQQEVEQPIKITISKEEETKQLEYNERQYQAQKKRIKYIKYYSRVYNLNEKKVVKIIKNTTNMLSEKSLNKKIKDSKLEFKILNKVQNIYVSSSSYTKRYGNLNKNNYEKKHTYREMVRHYAKLYGEDANKALAIEFHESGHLNAEIATVKHNPGAKRRPDGEYYTYPNMERGIIEHMITLSHYKGQSIQNMAARYLGSKKRAPGWAKEVQNYYNHLENNPNYYTLSDEKGSHKKKTKKAPFI